MKYFLILLFASAVTLLHAQQPGALDKNYGNRNGAEIISGTNVYAYCSAMQPDDKLIIGGTNPLNNQLLLARHNKDGSPDTSFGTNGTEATIFDSTNIFNYGQGWKSIAIQSDGKIVAMGNGGGYTIDDYSVYILVARFLPDGSPDETFGDGGKVISHIANDEIANAIALQPDGKIVVTGVSSSHVILLRYNEDGSADKSFGGGTGYTVSPVEYGGAFAIAVQQDGKIVTGGGYDLNTLFFLSRFLPDGTLDNTFGNGGTVTTYFENGASGIEIHSLAIDNGQRIVAAGLTQNFAANSRVAIARYLPDGTLDNSFDEDGKKIIAFSGGNGYATKVFLPNTDQIIIAGYAYTGNPNADFALAALNSKDGSFDSTFGTNGETTTDFGYNEKTFSAAMQSDGKIVLTALDEYNPPFPYINARYYGYPVYISLAVRIKRFLHNHSISWNGLPADDNIAYYSVEQSSSSIKGFTQVAKLSGRGNLKEYSTTNSSLLEGRNYYRVKAVSTDGTIRYSEVVSTDNTANTASVYPNPAKEYVTVQGLPATETTNISISDGSGNVKSKGVSNGAQYRSSLNNLQPGTYYVNITTGAKTETLKFVKE